MKTTFKKFLAILLATLVLLGVGAVSASAAPREKTLPAARAAFEGGDVNGTLEITKPGKAQISLFEYDDGYYVDLDWDLRGLAAEASGGGLAGPQTIRYDDLQARDYYKPQAGKIIWNVWVSLDWDNQPDGWKLGANQAILCVEGFQYTEFVPKKVIDGVQYGTFERKSVFCGEAPVVITGVEYRWNNRIDKAAATALTLGVPANVSIPAWDWEIEGRPFQWFKFTPAESGSYTFTSDGAYDGEELWTEDGERQYFPGVYLWAELYDEDGNYLSGNNGGGDCNFTIYRTLEADKTYYLCTSTYGEEGAAYTVTVETAEPRTLAAKASEITIKYGQVLAMDDLIETDWALWDLRVSCNGTVLMHGYDGDTDFTAYKTGKGTIIITAPDGEQVQIKVTVKAGVLDLIKIYLLGGWLAGGDFPSSWRRMLFTPLLIVSIPFVILALPAVGLLYLLAKWMGIV